MPKPSQVILNLGRAELIVKTIFIFTSFLYAVRLAVKNKA